MSAYTHSGLVYFVACGSYVKIGYTSTSIEKRLVSLRSNRIIIPDDLDRGDPLEVLRLIPGCIMRDEHRIHVLFERHHAIGEWYHLTPAFLVQLQRLDFVTDREILWNFREQRRLFKKAKALRSAA